MFSAPTAYELPSGLGARLAAGDAGAMRELIAARAGAVHAYAVAAGLREGRAAFVVAVLASARGAAQIDERLLQTARALAGGDGRRTRRRGRHGELGRRLRRRAERSFCASRSLAVPAAVAGQALHLLCAADDLRAQTGGAAGRAGGGWLPAGLRQAPIAQPGSPDATGPRDWLPAALHGVNGHASPPRLGGFQFVSRSS